MVVYIQPSMDLLKKRWIRLLLTVQTHTVCPPPSSLLSFSQHITSFSPEQHRMSTTSGGPGCDNLHARLSITPALLLCRVVLSRASPFIILPRFDANNNATTIQSDTQQQRQQQNEKKRKENAVDKLDWVNKTRVRQMIIHPIHNRWHLTVYNR